MRCAKLCLAALLLLAPAGCWGSRSLQLMSYVTAVGVDYRDGEYIAYVQVLNFRSVAKQEDAAIGEAIPVWVGKGKGKTLSEALSTIYSTSQIRVFWGHVRAVVVTENVLKNRAVLIRAFNALNRYREVRYNVYVYGTRMPLLDILSQNSLLNMSPLKTLLEVPEDTYRQRSIIPPIYGYKLVGLLRETGRTAVLPELSITPERWNEAKRRTDMFRINGAYFLDKEGYRGYYPERDLLGMRWVRRATVRNVVKSSDGDDPAATVVLGRPSFKVKPFLENGELRVDLSVTLNGELDELLRTIPIHQIEEQAASVVRKEIIDTYRKGAARQTDILNLLGVVYRKDKQMWRELQRSGSERMLTERTLHTVKVKVNIRHTGKYKGRTDNAEAGG